MSADQPYVGSLSLLASGSDVRKRSAEVVARHWSTIPRVSNVLDFGCGDGQLGRLLMATLPPDPTRELVAYDVDRSLMTSAVEAASQAGLATRPASPEDLEGATIFSGILLSHVIYYLEDVRSTLDRFRRMLSLDGMTTVILRSEDCDTYRLRQLVRDRTGLQARFTVPGVAHDMAESGLVHQVVDYTQALASVPCTRAEVVNFGRAAEDLGRESLEHFVRWMARLPQNVALDPQLRDDFVAFLSQRFDDNRVRLVVSDTVVTGSRDAID